jgi:hypothetical protein
MAERRSAVLIPSFFMVCAPKAAPERPSPFQYVIVVRNWDGVHELFEGLEPVNLLSY